MISHLPDMAYCWNLWQAVERLQQTIQRGAMAAFAMPTDGYYPRRVAESALNLPLVHTVSTLHEGLKQLHLEGHFPAKNELLGTLLWESRVHLPWINFKLMDEIRDRRNKLAHHGAMIPRDDCEKSISAIKLQLEAWKII